MFEKNQVFFLVSMYAISSASLFGIDLSALNLRQEILTHDNAHTTPETHPTLWALVEKLSEAANTNTPRYITLYESHMEKSPHLKEAVSTIDAWTDLLGDLYICREILHDLSFEEVEGILAIAISEKAINKPAKSLVRGLGTWAVTSLASICVFSSWIAAGDTYMTHRHFERASGSFERGLLLCYASLIPTLLVTIIGNNNLQKQADIKAAGLVGAQNVICGITGIEKFEKTCIKENSFDRLMAKMKLKGITDFVFYHLRSYTPDERVAYLTQIK